MRSIEAGDTIGFRYWIGFFAGFSALYWIIRTLLRRWGFVQFASRLKKVVAALYVRDLFLLENTAFESIGTGRMLGIYEKGVNVWSKLLHVTVRNGAAMMVTIAVATYVIGRNAPILLMVFLFLVCVSVALNRLVSARTRKAKLARKEILREGERHMIRMVMSKFETIQNDRIDQEVTKELSFFKRFELISEPQEFWSRVSTAIPGSAVDTLRLVLYFVVGTGVFTHTHSIADLAGIMALVALIDQSLQKFIETLDQFQQEFFHVRELWHTFDTTPYITNYDTGKTFISGSGTIELKNVSYRYAPELPEILHNFSLSIA